MGKLKMDNQSHSQMWFLWQLKVTIIFQLIFQAPLPILAQRFSEIQGPTLLRLQLAKSRWSIEPLEHWTDGGLSSLAQQAGHSNNMITEITALGGILLGWGSAPLLLENRRRQDPSHKTEGRSDKGAAWLSSRRHLVTPCLANLSNAGTFKAETAVWSGEWASSASSLLLVLERWKLRNQSVRSETGPYPGQSQSWATTGIVNRTDSGVIGSMTARLMVLGRDPMALYCTAEKIEEVWIRMEGWRVASIADFVRSEEPKGKPCDNTALRFFTIDLYKWANGFSTPII